MSLKPYRFNRQYSVHYRLPTGETFTAQPGDIRDFEKPPDSRWVLIVPKTPIPTPETGE